MAALPHYLATFDGCIGCALVVSCNTLCAMLCCPMPQVVHEPVEQWQRVPDGSGGTLNLLERFYEDPPKYAYTFQNYVSLSRVQQVGTDQGRRCCCNLFVLTFLT